MNVNLSRRHLLGAAGVAGAFATLPSMAFAQAATAKRLVFVIQRGAADGLAIMPPLGDPALMGLRAALTETEATPLDSMFALHPSLSFVSQMFATGQARGYHAIATDYRSRSHFDGQNVLESGASRPYELPTGWIGRLLPMLSSEDARALAMVPAVPLALRGEMTVSTYANNRLPDASEDLMQRLTLLYEADSELAPMWTEALKTKEMAGDIGGNNGRNGGELGKLAAALMNGPEAARVMMIETGGWDTHSAQTRRLSQQLTGMDNLLSELKTGLGDSWADTLVIVATEFGRTAAVNGTGGSDHGTASAALVLGGNLGPGDKVISDWPGLAAGQLYQGRDLAPTMHFGQMVTTEVSRHYRLDPEQVGAIFRL